MRPLFQRQQPAPKLDDDHLGHDDTDEEGAKATHQTAAGKMHTQLGEWTKLGFFTRAGHGAYALNTPGQPSSTTANGP